MSDPALRLERASADIPLTRDARDAIARAAAAAAQSGRPEPAPEDVLEAILQQRGSLVDASLRVLEVDPRSLLAARREPAAQPPPLPLRQLLVNANREAGVLGHHQVDSIHLLLAMLYTDSPSTSVPLQQAGLTLYDLRQHLQTGASPRQPTAAAPGRSSAPDRALRRRPWPSLRGVLSVSPVFLGIAGVTAGAGVLLWTAALPDLTGPLTIAFVTAGWIVSLCIHEFSHALVAYLGGDRDVAASGYLTLDPLRYTNLLLSIVMPIVFLLLGGIGLPGGAVYINRSALRSRAWDSAVSAAGPLGTLVCGLLVASPFLLTGSANLILAGHLAFLGALAFLGFIEAVAFLLNLLPVPGLDGFGILRPWLPYPVQAAANQFGLTAIIVIFVLLWYVAPARDAFFNVAYQLTSAWQIDPRLIVFGQLGMHL